MHPIGPRTGGHSTARENARSFAHWPHESDETVKLYASLAIQAARGGDDLYTTSLMTLADDLSPAERTRLVKARDAAIKSLHEYADWLEAGQSKMPDWQPMGETNYNYLLKHVLLLPSTRTM